MSLPRLGKMKLGAECLTKNWLELHQIVSSSSVKITLPFLLLLLKCKKMKRREGDKRREWGQLRSAVVELTPVFIPVHPAGDRGIWEGNLGRGIWNRGIWEGNLEQGDLGSAGS